MRRSWAKSANVGDSAAVLPVGERRLSTFGNQPVRFTLLILQLAWLEPIAAQIVITEQPSDQVVILRNGLVPSGPLETFSEDFNGSDGGFTAETPIPYDGPWIHDPLRGSWREDGQGPENYHANTSFLTSPPILVTRNGGLAIVFSHRYSFEFDGNRWDGGQLRLSVNNGPFLPTLTGAFIQNGYEGTRVDARNPSVITGQEAFTGESTNYAEGFITSVAIVGSFRTGETVRIQFVAGGDTNTRGLVPNWEISSLQIVQGLDVRTANFGIAIDDLRSDQSPLPTYQWYREVGSQFQPLAGENAPQFSLTPTLSDNGALFRCEVSLPTLIVTSRIATLTVVQPNSRPIFSKGPDQTVTANSGLHTITNWATGIQAFSEGEFPEPEQRLFFLLIPAHREYFSVQPKVDTNGTLTFTPMLNACGTSVVTTFLRDFGETGFGGDNRSAVSTFEIRILCATNNCPVATSISLIGQRDTVINFQLPATDREGGPLEYRITQGPQHGVAAYSTSTGSGQYSPSNGYCGNDGFRFNVTDGNCISFEATVTLRTTCCPYSSNTTVSVLPNSRPVFLTLPGGDLDGDPVTYRVTREPQHGVIYGGRPGEFAPNQLTYAPFERYLGPDSISFRVSDGGCEPEESTVTINVVDLVPPEIYCFEGDITTEFTGTTGTVVNFFVYSDDLSAVSLSCTPPPGSTFPIGITTVLCTATDTSGNSNSCGFTVTVLGARSVRTNVLVEIMSWDGFVTNPANRRRLAKIIWNLACANDSSLWLNENQLITATGTKVFNLDQEVVQALWAFIRDRRDIVPDDVLLDWIARLAKTDRLLADLSVEAAEAGGGDPRKIAEYRKTISNADAAVVDGRTAAAVARYLQVWKATNHP
jgi:hypothetical protein